MQNRKGDGRPGVADKVGQIREEMKTKTTRKTKGRGRMGKLRRHTEKTKRMERIEGRRKEKEEEHLIETYGRNEVESYGEDHPLGKPQEAD